MAEEVTSQVTKNPPGRPKGWRKVASPTVTVVEAEAVETPPVEILVEPVKSRSQLTLEAEMEAGRRNLAKFHARG